MTLAIQSNLPGALHLWVLDRLGRVVGTRRQAIDFHGSDQLLRLVDSCLPKSNIRAMNAIVVVRGPGPFTAVRTGIVVANTLGWALSVPVIGITSAKLLSPSLLSRLCQTRKKKFLAVRPAYGRAPNISRSLSPVAKLRSSRSKKSA